MADHAGPGRGDLSALHRANLEAVAFASHQVPYADAADHLRDELWQVWLRVEHETRRRWELEAIPLTQHEGTLGDWQPRELGGWFRAAHAEYARTPAVTAEHGASAALDLWRRQVARIEQRLALGSAAPLPISELARRFRLDGNQRRALVVALACELDPGLAIACRYLLNDPTARGLDGRLLAALVYDTPALRGRLAQDLSPTSPLVRHRLLEVEEGGRAEATMLRRVRAAPRLLAYVSGAVAELDAELAGVARLVLSAGTPQPDRAIGVVAARVAAAVTGSERVWLVLAGVRGVGKRHLARAVGWQLGRGVIEADGAALAALPAAGQGAALRSLARDASLLDAVLVVVDADAAAPGAERAGPPTWLAPLAELVAGPIVLTQTGERRLDVPGRPAVRLELPVPDAAGRRAVWQAAAPALAADAARELGDRFAVAPGVIVDAARAAGPGADGAALATAVQGQLHGRLDAHARRYRLDVGFADLVVDDDTRAALHEIVAAVRDRRTVREAWGMRGAPGVSVLFNGHPGVGKTMSAAVVAGALGLPLYEIDLSQVMSKWIGETEKNLAELFDAAEPGHAVLLFNEADSLFGKRTADVQNANDRHANLETNYLLQRLERFGGLAILTTNLARAIDAAFRRRLAFDLQFAFPTADLRAELWRRALPQAAVAADLDVALLGERFELSGGYIKVAAERAAFLAAAGDGTITMARVVDAVERIYRERGKLSAVGKLE